MKTNNKVLGLIPARGGSKGLPGKNIMDLSGKPMIAWTIEAAKNSKVIDQVVLSSECEEIISIAKFWGCSTPFKRPKDLATDEAKSIDVVLHTLAQLPNFDYIIILQPTSPLRTANHIDSAFKLLQDNNSKSCVSVCEVEQSPYWMFRINQNLRLERIIKDEEFSHRRQDLPLAYYPNGAIYIAKVDWLLKNKKLIDTESIAYTMKKEDSIDIDNINDLKIAMETINTRTTTI